MKYQNILFETQDNIAEIKLNRPQLLNSFNYEMADEFLDALKKCDKIILLENGEIKKEGKFEELIKSNKNFYSVDNS